jgi:hypothetical protein
MTQPALLSSWQLVWELTSGTTTWKVLPEQKWGERSVVFDVAKCEIQNVE